MGFSPVPEGLKPGSSRYWSDPEGGSPIQLAR